MQNASAWKGQLDTETYSNCSFLQNRPFSLCFFSQTDRGTIFPWFCIVFYMQMALPVGTFACHWALHRIKKHFIVIAFCSYYWECVPSGRPFEKSTRAVKSANCIAKKNSRITFSSLLPDSNGISKVMLRHRNAWKIQYGIMLSKCSAQFSDITQERPKGADLPKNTINKLWLECVNKIRGLVRSHAEATKCLNKN